MKAPLALVLSVVALLLTACPANTAKPAADQSEISPDRSTDRMADTRGGNVDTSRDPALDSSLMAGSDTRTTYGAGGGSTYVPPSDSSDGGVYSAPAAPPPVKTASARRTETSGDESLTPRKSSGGRTYTVKKGDTLSSISHKFYGTPNKWKKIQSANRAKVPDERKLQPGTTLLIP